jgi:undecaprenyl-diphosphatase
VDFSEILKSALLGIVQGITEWLPISSTGHLIILKNFLQLRVSESFWNLFLVVVQLGSVLAVINLYFKKLNPFDYKKSSSEKRESLNLWCKVIVGSVPVAIFGFFLDNLIKNITSNSKISIAIVALTLIVYGIIFILIEREKVSPIIRNFKNLSYRHAFLVGCFEVLSLVPGTSRSGSTILGAMFLGASRTLSAEFSFFLSIPAMFGASFIRLFKYILVYGFSFTSLELLILLAGTLMAYIISIFAIKFLTSYIKKKSFKIFGVYRIMLGLALVLYLFF